MITLIQYLCVPASNHPHVFENIPNKKPNFDDLKILFETEDPDEEFYGFERNEKCPLETIFEKEEDPDETFYGFEMNDKFGTRSEVLVSIIAGIEKW